MTLVVLPLPNLTLPTLLRMMLGAAGLTEPPASLTWSPDGAGSLSDSSIVLAAPLSQFSGLASIPCLASLADKVESRGTHQIIVSIVPPAGLDVELSQRLLDFFEAEFNDEAADAIADAIAGSTVFIVTMVRTPASANVTAPTVIGALTARLGDFGLYSSYLLTRPGIPSKVLFPHLGTKPWQRRGIGGFLLALAGPTRPKTPAAPGALPHATDHVSR